MHGKVCWLIAYDRALFDVNVLLSSLGKIVPGPAAFGTIYPGPPLGHLNRIVIIILMPGGHHSLIMPDWHYSRTLSGFNLQRIRHYFLIISVNE